MLWMSEFTEIIVITWRRRLISQIHNVMDEWIHRDNSHHMDKKAYIKNKQCYERIYSDTGLRQVKAYSYHK